MEKKIKKVKKEVELAPTMGETAKNYVIKSVKNREISTESILGGVVNVGINSQTGEEVILDDMPRDYKADIEAIPEDERVTKITVVDPTSGNSHEVTLDRRGMHDEKLGEIMVSPDLSQDEKMSAVSLYLFERGRESSSFLVDIIQSKGKFFKGAHEFQSAMRFDFQVFIETFSHYLTATAQSTLNYVLPGAEITELEEEAHKWMKDNPGNSIMQFSIGKIKAINSDNTEAQITKYDVMFLERAIRDASEAKLLKTRIQEVAEEREQAKGKGIHLTPDGKAYKE